MRRYIERAGEQNRPRLAGTRRRIMGNGYYGQDRGYSPQNRDDMGGPQKFGSARSDYGQLAYGGDLNYKGEQRGWLDRTADEVTSWFGDEGAERRRRMDRSRDNFRNRDQYRRGRADRYGMSDVA